MEKLESLFVVGFGHIFEEWRCRFVLTRQTEVFGHISGKFEITVVHLGVDIMLLSECEKLLLLSRGDLLKLKIDPFLITFLITFFFLVFALVLFFIGLFFNFFLIFLIFLFVLPLFIVAFKEGQIGPSNRILGAVFIKLDSRGLLRFVDGYHFTFPVFAVVLGRHSITLLRDLIFVAFFFIFVFLDLFINLFAFFFEVIKVDFFFVE